MATYTTINPYAKNVQAVNAIVYLVEQTDTLRPDNTEESGSLKALSDDDWKLLANINTIKFSNETENDEVEYFDADTKTRVKDPQTVITRRTIEMTAVNIPPILDAIMKGAPNPTSAETLADLSAGSADGVPFGQSNDPYVNVALKIALYNGNKQKLQTILTYARISATGDVEYNGKTVQPTITAEVQPSIHGKFFNEAAFTKQTVTAGA